MDCQTDKKLAFKTKHYPLTHNGTFVHCVRNNERTYRLFHFVGVLLIDAVMSDSFDSSFVNSSIFWATLA